MFVGRRSGRRAVVYVAPLGDRHGELHGMDWRSNMSVHLTLFELATGSERSLLGVVWKRREIGMVAQVTSSLERRKESTSPSSEKSTRECDKDFPEEASVSVPSQGISRDCLNGTPVEDDTETVLPTDLMSIRQEPPNMMQTPLSAAIDRIDRSGDDLG